MRRRRRRETINLNRRLQTARLAGRLVDGSDVALKVGLKCRCEVSVDLWNSLFWRYPSARKRDCVDLQSVLNSFHNPFDDYMQTQPPQLFIRPPASPWWIGPRFFVKLLLVYRRDKLDGIVVVPEKASLTSLFSEYRPPLPATLLLKMLLACRGLHLIARPAERASIGSLQEIVCQMLRTSPLFAELREYHASLDPPVVPSEFTLEEYREVLCHELYQLLGIAGAVAQLTGSDFRLPVTSVLQLLACQVSMMPLTAATTISQKIALLH